MAKRKRLTPAQPAFLDGPAPGQKAPETKSVPLSENEELPVMTEL